MKTYLLLITAGLSLGACSSMNADHANSFKQDKVFVLKANQTMGQSLKVGDIFIIELESNPSTGYRWMISNRREVQKCLQLKKEQTFPASQGAQPHIVGASGKQQWQFLAKCVADVQLRFEYKRPWEAVTVPASARAQLNLRIQ